MSQNINIAVLIDGDNIPSANVKEMMLYDELNLTEISYKLRYSSVAHLSNQLKKVTGLTPTFYKKMKKERNRNLENI